MVYQERISWYTTQAMQRFRVCSAPLLCSPSVMWGSVFKLETSFPTTMQQKCKQQLRDHWLMPTSYLRSKIDTSASNFPLHKRWAFAHFQARPCFQFSHQVLSSRRNIKVMCSLHDLVCFHASPSLKGQLQFNISPELKRLAGGAESLPCPSAALCSRLPAPPRLR